MKGEKSPGRRITMSNKQQTRVELLVENIAVEKQILIEICDDLAFCRDNGDKKEAKKATQDLNKQISKYNSLVAEYNKLTGEKAPKISTKLAEEIMAGSNNYGIETVGQPVTSAVNAYNANISILDQNELKKYLSRSDRALQNVKVRLANTVKQKNETTGYNKVLLIINCLTYQRYVVERIAENLHVCNKLNDEKRVKDLKKTLTNEIKAYNSFVDEYEVLTRARLTRASEDIPADIIAGKPFAAIPAISYTANDGTARNSDADVAAVAAAAAAEVEAAANNKKHIKNNKKKVQKTALEEKVTEQANKDLTVVTKGYDFKISLFESQKDMSYYRFNKNVFDMKAVKNAANKKIKEAQKAHKEALKYEERDNGRYYAVITNDPVTMKCSKRKADRVKIASIRTQMMTLLNKRDELNSKLLSIYNGSEVTADGVSINQKWRQTKSDAAEKFVNKNQALAKKIFRLPASSAEKQRLYGILNSSVEASSNLALAKFRVKTKEFKNSKEKRALKKDVKIQTKLIKQNSKDIKWIIKKIAKRA